MSFVAVQNPAVDSPNIRLWQVIWVLLKVCFYSSSPFLPTSVCPGISICRERSQKHDARRRRISDARKLWPELQARRADRLWHVGPAAASAARWAPSHFIPRRVEPCSLSGNTGFSFRWLIPPVSFCFEAGSHSHLFTMECMSSLSFSRRRSPYSTSKSSFV